MTPAAWQLAGMGATGNVKGKRTRGWIVGAIGAPLLCLATMHAGGCGNAPAPSNSGVESNSPAQTAATAKSAKERYDLERDEQRGGHTLSRHVARTDAELAERLEREHISAASTWTDRAAAEETVAEALRDKRGRVESWTRRGYPRANLALHYSAGRAIGRSLRRGESAAEPCTDAVIVLRADGPDGFYVLTAYPEAGR